MGLATMIKLTRKNLLAWLSMTGYAAKHVVTQEPQPERGPLSFRSRDEDKEAAARKAKPGNAR